MILNIDWQTGIVGARTNQWLLILISGSGLLLLEPINDYLAQLGGIVVFRTN